MKGHALSNRSAVLHYILRFNDRVVTLFVIARRNLKVHSATCFSPCGLGPLVMGIISRFAVFALVSRVAVSDALTVLLPIL